MLNHGAPGMLQVRPSGAQQQKYLGASEKSTHSCHRYLDAASASPMPPALLAAIPLPLKHSATKNDYFYIFLKWRRSYLVGLPAVFRIEQSILICLAQNQHSSLLFFNLSR